MEEAKVENRIPEVENTIAEITSTTRGINTVPTKNAVSQDPEKNLNQPNAADEIEDIQYATGIKLATLVSAVTLTAILITLDGSILATATPKITDQFHSLPDVGWYGAAYLLTSSALQPATGKLYAHFSIKYTYIAFIGIFELGSLICGVATSFNMLIVGRAVAGMGSAGVGNGALTIVSAMVPLEKRALYISITGSFGQLGVVFGTLIGGALTEYTTWRWCFYLNLPIGGFAVAALLWVAVPKLNKEDHKRMNLISLFHELDIMGCLLFSPSMIMFLLALQWGGSTYPWNSAVIIGLFCGSAGNIAVFLIWEYKKGYSAMIPFQMVKKRVIYCCGLNIFFLYANNVVTAYYLAIYFQGVRGKTPTLSGVYTLPRILGQMICGILAGFTVIGTALAAVGSGLISTFTKNTNTGTWIGYQIIAGVGRGLSIQMPLVAVQTNVPVSQIAVSMAFLKFCQNFGGSLLLSFAETAFDIGLDHALPKYAPGVSAATVSSAGVSGIRTIIPQDKVTGVIMAYMVGVKEVFYVVAGTTAVAVVFGCGLGWKSVKKAKNSESDERQASRA
ncbi:uncharacterized protein N7483_011272 [Penicillium malachiteum]|uniref:uncharacterized protein n=1 Tax=Penicillium malachiteum TaxID=1324776 RepID=UPI002547783C|nr:uncharacterized protein N7483_011272 [Penicillium malachiteum]KAJ5714091.1 hypothetical protein N7483_011272 [Penicillium malachiteum]